MSSTERICSTTAWRPGLKTSPLQPWVEGRLRPLMRLNTGKRTCGRMSCIPTSAGIPSLLALTCSLPTIRAILPSHLPDSTACHAYDRTLASCSPQPQALPTSLLVLQTAVGGPSPSTTWGMEKHRGPTCRQGWGDLLTSQAAGAQHSGTANTFAPRSQGLEA